MQGVDNWKNILHETVKNFQTCKNLSKFFKIFSVLQSKVGPNVTSFQNVKIFQSCSPLPLFCSTPDTPTQNKVVSNPSPPPSTITLLSVINLKSSNIIIAHICCMDLPQIFSCTHCGTPNWDLYHLSEQYQSTHWEEPSAWNKLPIAEKVQQMHYIVNKVITD